MKKQFINALRTSFEENLKGITPLQAAIREKAWSRFLEIGLPTKHDPGYQYLPLSTFYREQFELGGLPSISKEQFTPFIYSECRQSHIVFVNGQYVPELSDTSALREEIVILRLRDALTSFGSFLQGRLSRSIKEEKDPFILLNIAMIQMGLFMYVPPNIVVDKPIQCLNIICNESPVIFNPRSHFFIGANSQVKWLFGHHCLKDFESFSNSVVDVALEEGARFEQYGILKPCAHGWASESVRVTLKKGSHFKSLVCNAGTKSVREDYRIALLGENSSCDLKGVSALSENRQAHVNVLIDHEAPYCQSNQLFKNIVSDTSRVSFEGKIYVHPKAQKTEAYQLNNNLILDDKAIASSKPNLEIFADDVKASHGSTVSQIRPDHLLYLKSRGIGPLEGKRLLLSGFSSSIFNEVPFTAMRERMQHIAEQAIK